MPHYHAQEDTWMKNPVDVLVVLLTLIVQLLAGSNERTVVNHNHNNVTVIMPQPAEPQPQFPRLRNRLNR
jgi:hypothetical protein